MNERKIAIVAMLIIAPHHANAESIEGNWTRGDGNARVRIERCGADLCAVNTWIKNETEQKEHVGDKLIFNVKDAGDSYSGTAYDPQRNMKMSARLNLAGNLLVSQGCVLMGLVCKSMNWTRSK